MAHIWADYRTVVQYEAAQFNPITLAETERGKTILACFEPGQFIPVHAPAVDLTLAVLEGEGHVVAGIEEERIGPGAIVVVPAGKERGVRAETRLVALHVVTPTPSAADHAEVRAGPERGG